MKYWHEISQEEIDKLFEDKATVGFVLENYKQPDWCHYPEALSGIMGCWSLMDKNLRTEISHDYCKTCECYKITE